ncbi:hypothetical protein [Paraburkholderia fungorum]|uniref:hypothetical protein n=1 Tax=Paraburkholderia fungorum TaxID=134537 RepID=UPI00115FE27B|nr:hypothetical protein [Paraburkholderia fungorum]
MKNSLNMNMAFDLLCSVKMSALTLDRFLADGTGRAGMLRFFHRAVYDDAPPKQNGTIVPYFVPKLATEYDHFPP